jgi:hypothetical protein
MSAITFYQATRILDSVADLTEEIKTDKVSDRLNSPVYSHAGFHGGNPAIATKPTRSLITNRVQQ